MTKVSYHSQFAFLAANAPALRAKAGLEAGDAGAQQTREFLERGVGSGARMPFGPASLPPLARFDVASTAGAVSDKFQRELDEFVGKARDGQAGLLATGGGAGGEGKGKKKSKKKDKGAKEAALYEARTLSGCSAGRPAAARSARMAFGI